MNDGDDDQSPQEERQRGRSRSRERIYPRAQVPQEQQTQPMVNPKPDDVSDEEFSERQSRVSDRERSPQEREDSRRQGPQKQKGKKTVAEEQPSEPPKAKKHKSIDSDEDDE